MTTFKARVQDCLEGSRSGTRNGKLFESFIVTLIVLNTLAVVLGSVKPLRDGYGNWFFGFEVASILIFTLEYLARLWTCTLDPRYAGPVKGRIRFMLSPLAIVDLLAFLPFYLPLLGLDLRFMRLFRAFRILRVVKLSRYSDSFQILVAVLKNRKDELILTLTGVLVLMVVTSSLMFYIENAVQPQKFPDIPTAMWWSIITLTTVGYGDVYPVTELGRILAALTAILGSATLAFPAGILGAGFVEELRKRRPKTAMRCPHCGKELP